MRLHHLLVFGLLLPVFSQAESPFEKASRNREAARQKAFDRGQKTALPAAEQREKIADQKDVPLNALRTGDGEPVYEGPPSSKVYNRVMETQRHLRLPPGAIPNANDTFISTPEATEFYDQEAERLYPQIKQPGSAFAMRHAVISRWIDNRQPPLAKDSRRKLLIAHMVSLELKGRLHEDAHFIGRNIKEAPTRSPSADFLSWSTFEITVNGDSARLPDGQIATFKAGAFNGADQITWQQNGLSQTITIPPAGKGVSVLPGNQKKKYLRQPTLNDGWRFTFLP